MEFTQKTDKTLVRMQTSEGVCLKALFERLQRFRDCCLEFSPTEMSMNATTTSNTTIALLALDKIDEYYCRHNISVGIDISAFFRLCKKLVRDDIFVFTIDEDSVAEAMPYGTIYVYNEERKVLITYKIHFLDIVLEKYTIPPKVFSAVCTVPSVELFKVLRWCSDAGSVVQLYTTLRNKKTYLVVETKCLDQSELDAARVCVHMDITDNVVGGGNGNGIVVPLNVYSVSTLLEVSRSGSMSSGGNALIYLSDDDYPLVIVYNVGAMGTIKFCVGASLTDTDLQSPDDDAVDKMADTIEDEEGGETAAVAEEDFDTGDACMDDYPE